MFMDISSEMIHGLLPVYLVAVLGTSALTVGIIEGLAEATAAATKVFSGVLSDRLGRRKLLATVGYAMAALTKPVFPLAPAIEWLVAARFVDRVGKGIRGAPRDALVADIAPPALRGAAYGLRQALDTTGAFVGPLLAIALMAATANDFVVVFWIAVLPAFLAVVTLVLGVEEPARRAGDGVAAAPPLGGARALGTSFWRVTALAAVLMIARVGEPFLVLRAQGLGLPFALAPAVLVAMNVVYALAAFPAGALADRVDHRRLLALGLVVLVAADLCLAAADGFMTAAAGIVLWGLHMALTQGLLAALVANAAPAALRGTAFGLFNLASGAALLAGGIGAGALWDQLGGAGAFAAGAVLACIALAGLLVLPPPVAAR
ncbi:MAG: MFS transporter [Alphaproteobacteria bacterium]|nr:MFS transporter [Alphaproteobacteria bacterium]